MAIKLNDLAQRIGATLLTVGASDSLIEHVYAGDRISDLLSHARDGTLLVSNLAGPSLTRLVELMNPPAICLVGRQMPSAKVVAAAQEHHCGLIVSPASLFETCGRLYPCLPHRSGA